MKDEGVNRRSFLKTAVAGSAVAAGSVVGSGTAEAQPRGAAAPQPGYAFFNPEEAAFIEAVVDHMIPADELTPKGTDVGINIYIDRALAGGWGKGDRMYVQGPWKVGHPNQGYQLPFTPAELYRAGIEQTGAYCRQTYGKPFDRLSAAEKQDVLTGLRDGKITFASGLPARTFFGQLYQNVMEGMFSDPIHGGNRDKAGWKLVGFPGVIAVHRENVAKFRNRKYVADPKSIPDLS